MPKTTSGATPGKTDAESAVDALVPAAPVKDTGTSADGIGGGKRFTTQTLRDEAGKLGSKATGRARELADEGKTKATSALEEFSKLMQDAAGSVDDRLGQDYGNYARSAANGISKFADTLKSKQVDDLLDDATALVKKSPAIAIGTAAAVGFVIARLIKSGVDAAADLGDRDDKPETKA